MLAWHTRGPQPGLNAGLTRPWTFKGVAFRRKPRPLPRLRIARGIERGGRPGLSPEANGIWTKPTPGLMGLKFVGGPALPHAWRSSCCIAVEDDRCFALVTGVYRSENVAIGLYRVDSFCPSEGSGIDSSDWRNDSLPKQMSLDEWFS